MPSQGQKAPRRGGWEGRGSGGGQAFVPGACRVKGRMREMHCAGHAPAGAEDAGKRGGESVDSEEVKVSESKNPSEVKPGARLSDLAQM